MKYLMLVALATFGCALPEYHFVDESKCSWVEVPRHVPDGSCFTVTANGEWSTIATCEGTESQNQTFKDWGDKGQEMSSFEIPGGGCYMWYTCDGSTAPSVTACK